MSAITPQVYEHEGAVYADSRQVAEAFGKRHDARARRAAAASAVLAGAGQCVAAQRGHRLDQGRRRQAPRPGCPASRAEILLAAGESNMTRRITDAVRTAIGMALVVVAVIACAVVQLAADDREDER